MGNVKEKAGLLALTLLLAGCTGGTIYKKDKLGEVNVLSVDARQRLVLQGKVGNQTVTCTEPSPDAIVAQAAELAASAKVPVNGTQVAGQIAGGFQESAASIAMRTQTIQMLRDGYFRLCEAHMNGLIGKKEYTVTMMFIDEFIATVVAIEAIGGTVQAPAVAINVTGGATASDGQASANGEKPAEGIKVGDIRYDTRDLNKDRADAIKEIVQNYYRRKAAFQAYLDGSPSTSGQSD